MPVTISFNAVKLGLCLNFSKLWCFNTNKFQKESRFVSTWRDKVKEARASRASGLCFLTPVAWRTEQLLPNSPRAHCDIPLLSFTQHTLNQSWAWLTHTSKAVQRMKREEVISFWIQQIFHCLAMDVGISPCFCNLSFSGALSRLRYGTDLPSSALTNHGRVVCQSPQMANEQLA